MKFNYDELVQLLELAQAAKKYDLASKVHAMMQEEWHPGTEMPPLNVHVMVLTHGTLRKARRVELLPAYSGKGENGYTVVHFESEQGEQFSVKASAFGWRRP